MAPALCGLVAAVLSAHVISPAVPPSGLVEAVVGREVNALAQTLAARRGLHGAHPLAVGLRDRAGLRAAHEALAVPLESPQEARDRAVLHDRLGLEVLDRAGHPNAEEDDAVATVDLEGLYDPRHREILLGNWFPWEAGGLGLARDVAVALLDQRFGLEAWLARGSRAGSGQAESDAELARQAVLEGDALVQAIEHLDPRGALPPPRALADAASEVRGMILAENADATPVELERRLFVELDGLTFVAAVRARAPWKVVDELWNRPPLSTAEVLHPELRAHGHRPDDVRARVPDKLAGGWRAAYADTLGEVAIRTFLDRFGDRYVAERAAAGWGGDRVVLYRAPAVEPAGTPRELVVWATTWGDGGDAEDFANEATRVLALLAGAPAPDRHAGPGRARFVDPAGRLFAIERRRATVVMLFAAPPGAEGALGTVLASTARTAAAGRR